MRKGIIGIDLFCGAGGLTRGLLDAGISVKKGYDIDHRVKDTYEKNNNGVKFFCTDIKDLNKDEILKNLDLKNNYLLLAGCAPCQPFSVINKKNKKRDGRRYLLDEFGRLIEDIKPEFILLENVPGLVNKGKEIFKRFLRTLDEENYHYVFGNLDAKNFGVPQKRLRLILLASKHHSLVLPEEKYGLMESGKLPYVTVRDTIAKYHPLGAGYKSRKIPNHESRDLAEINKKRMKYIKKNGGSRTNLPKHLRLKCHEKHEGHSDVYGRMRWDDVSPTLTCKCTSISNGRFGHPSQARGISVREAAALQTFKDNYVFHDCLSVATEWVGNAVPVKFAETLGNKFIESIGH